MGNLIDGSSQRCLGRVVRMRRFDRKNQRLKRRLKGTLIISCLQVRVLPAPPRILVLTEISPNPAISPESAGFCE